MILRENEKKGKWRLLVFRRTMAMLSVNLVLSALVAGVYGSRIYFAFAACASGILLLGRAWKSQCCLADGRQYKRTPARVPFILRGAGARPVRKPAFLMGSADFDDDLTPFTVAGEEDYSDEACWKAKSLSCLLCGMLMLLLSFVL